MDHDATRAIQRQAKAQMAADEHAARVLTGRSLPAAPE